MVFQEPKKKKIEPRVLFDAKTVLGCLDRNYNLKNFWIVVGECVLIRHYTVGCCQKELFKTAKLVQLKEVRTMESLNTLTLEELLSLSFESLILLNGCLYGRKDDIGEE